jgi:hypothetical protein
MAQPDQNDRQVHSMGLSYMTAKQRQVLSLTDARFLSVIYFYSYIKKEEPLIKVYIPPANLLNRKKKATKHYGDKI